MVHFGKTVNNIWFNLGSLAKAIEFISIYLIRFPVGPVRRLVRHSSESDGGSFTQRRITKQIKAVDYLLVKTPCH
jgi:hypothetical protein